MPNSIYEESNDIRNHGDKKREFDKLLPAPRAFEVFAPEVNDSRGNDERDDVVLNQSAREERPWKYDRLGWNQDQVGNCPSWRGQVN